MEIERLRCRSDREIAESLFQERAVKRVRRKIEEAEKKGPAGVRRQLLATSLRITPAMSRTLHEDTLACVKALGVDQELETFVYPSPQFNAAAVRPEEGRLFVMFSSSLLESFKGPELRYVIGHELGHHLFGHHDIPIGYLLKGEEPPPADLALKLFAWSRYAEISADRAGAFCADDPDGVAKALFRLASGLRTDMLDVSIEDFAKQVEDMQLETDKPGQGAPESDWFSTHPFSPLRLKAVKAFFESTLMTNDKGAKTTDELEAEVQTLMALMEPSYLDERSDVAEGMRRLLFAGSIAVANAHDGISEHEIAAFEKFFGETSFRDNLDIEAICAGVLERATSARDVVPHARRIQVLRDLCVIARADNHVDEKERHLLHEIAKKLNISTMIIDQTLNAPVEPD